MIQDSQHWTMKLRQSIRKLATNKVMCGTQIMLKVSDPTGSGSWYWANTLLTHQKIPMLTHRKDTKNSPYLPVKKGTLISKTSIKEDWKLPRLWRGVKVLTGRIWLGIGCQGAEVLLLLALHRDWALWRLRLGPGPRRRRIRRGGVASN
jgi:hypothetical protein